MIACCLHDIGYQCGRDVHAQNGAILARQYLSDNNFLQDDIEKICYAIANHGGKTIQSYQNKISLCLILADKLDFISSR